MAARGVHRLTEARPSAGGATGARAAARPAGSSPATAGLAAFAPEAMAVPVASAFAAAFAAAALAVPPLAAQAPPDTVRIQDAGLHPEGVEWDADRGRFLVSSVTRGTVTAVEDDGTLTQLTEAPEGGLGSIGVHIDAAHGRLLVAHADVGVFQGASQGAARLGVYDLETGERIRVVELAELRPDVRHFANDVTSAPDGTLYVTDSFAPVIYRVTPDGEASVLVEDDRLRGQQFGLNGIDHHPDGYLLVAVAGRRTLVKVPLDAPGEFTDVELPEPFAADGLVLADDGTLVAVSTTFGEGGQPRSETLWLRSSDGWQSAEIVGRAPTPGATTGALRGDAVYVVNPHFQEMGAGQTVEVFEVYRVRPDGGP